MQHGWPSQEMPSFHLKYLEVEKIEASLAKSLLTYTIKSFVLCTEHLRLMVLLVSRSAYGKMPWRH